MPKETLTRSLIRELKPAAAPYEVRDDKLPGLILRVSPSGRMVYVVQYGRGKRVNIGRADVLMPSDAREKARELLGDVAKGIDPMEERRKAKEDADAHTLGTYLDKVYTPWVRAHHRDGDETIASLKAAFADMLDTRMDELTAWEVEKWRSQRVKQGAKPATVNRLVSSLKAVFSRAQQWGHVSENPLGAVKPMKLDAAGIVRYLTDDEEARLRAALSARDERLRLQRESANAWRRARHYPELPSLPAFGDHITPMVLVSLNTGIRRGEAFGLRWSDVDLERAMLTVRGEGAKSKQTRHVPLNAEALDVLTRWNEQSSGDLVFANIDGHRLTDVKTAWRKVLADSKIIGFRWHDLRHTFASRLVMAGVDLNTVRELLGHADLKMTLRYAHLAPHVKVDAVARLMRKEADVVQLHG